MKVCYNAACKTKTQVSVCFEIFVAFPTLLRMSAVEVHKWTLQASAPGSAYPSTRAQPLSAVCRDCNSEHSVWKKVFLSLLRWSEGNIRHQGISFAYFGPPTAVSSCNFLWTSHLTEAIGFSNRHLPACWPGLSAMLLLRDWQFQLYCTNVSIQNCKYLRNTFFLCGLLSIACANLGLTISVSNCAPEFALPNANMLKC